jgi:hypothetical protein
MIRERLEAMLDERLRSERGDVLTFTPEPPAGAEQLRFGERCLQAAPAELLEMLRFSNGCAFFGVRVLSASELYCTEDDEVVFHEWGTGDVSALNPGTGAVVYRGHDPFDKTLVAGSLEEWFEAVYQEIKSLGYLSHPDDSHAQARYSMYYPPPP